VTPDGRDGNAARGGTAYVGLLTEIMSNTLDQDYQVAADRRRVAPAPAHHAQRLTAVVVVLLFGVMLGISALRTHQLAPATAAERDQLVAQIHVRQHRLDVLHTQLAKLDSAVAGLQSSVSTNTGLQRQLASLGSQLAAVTGAGAVTGPGMEIVADNAPAALGLPTGGVILDTDLQALVNALWTAGAEAIAINGNRLTSLTAIRFAGRAITVDYRSLTPPYVIDVIGNPQTLPARLLETPGGQAWLGLRANFGIRFDTTTRSDLVLPGDPTVGLREARPVGAR
jgi:uncharacterized protein YlxW (UPF0749 family)